MKEEHLLMYALVFVLGFVVARMMSGRLVEGEIEYSVPLRDHNDINKSCDYQCKLTCDFLNDPRIFNGINENLRKNNPEYDNCVSSCKDDSINFAKKNADNLTEWVRKDIAYDKFYETTGELGNGYVTNCAGTTWVKPYPKPGDTEFWDKYCKAKGHNRTYCR